MKPIHAQLEEAFRDAIRRAFGVEADPAISISQNEKFGDYQSNAAMALAKTLAKTQKANPRQVAEKIKSALALGEMATEISIAGPGFVNVRLNPEWLASLLQQASADPRSGIPLVENPQTIVVDYSGPNIAKQMHVGHLRSTIIGDAISRVVEFQGHKVIRQNHIGDWGTQFGMLIAFWRDAWNPRVDTGSSIEMKSRGPNDRPIITLHIADLEEFYRLAKKRFDEEPEFQSTARQTVVKLQTGEPEITDSWISIVEQTRLHYLPLYESLSVRLHLSDERGESFYNPFLPQVVEELKSKGLATESDGATVVFVDGPDKSPLIIQKTDGGYLYGTTDLAAIRFRVDVLHADRIIYPHDSRQAQHFSQVFRTADQAGWTRDGQVKLEYAPFGTMLGEDGKPFKTRSGDTVKLKDLLDEAESRGYELAKAKEAERLARAQERGDANVKPISESELRKIGTDVGIGGVKYSDLSKDRVSDYVFSWDKMLSLDGNTAPYLQYVYARIRSIFRKEDRGEGEKERGEGRGARGEGKIRLESPYELALAKQILRLGETIEGVARDLKPHQLCTYLYELATRFSSFYENCPVLQSDEPTRSSRLALADLTARTMARGLDLLGIEHPEQM